MRPPMNRTTRPDLIPSMIARFRQPTIWSLAALLMVAALLRFRGLAFGLPHTQARPDETAIIDPVRILLSGHLPHFYDYSWLFLWVVSLAYVGYFLYGAALGTFHSMSEMLASWPVHWEPFFLIPRAISASAGTLSILAVFRLGRQLRDDATGIVSALFLTFAFIHAISSHFGTTDIVMTYLIVCAVSFLIDAHRSGNRRRFALAGLIAGLAAATKYNAVVLIVPMLVSYALTVLDARGHRRRAWREDGILYFGVAFGLAFVIVGVPFIIADRAPFLAAMRELAHALTVGDVRLEQSNGWLYHLSNSLRYGIGLPLLAAGIAGAAALLWFERRVALLFLSFPIAYYLVAGGFRLLFFRYTLPVVPFLCVTAAYLVCLTCAWVVSQLPTRVAHRALYFRATTAVLAVTMVWSSAVKIWAFDQVMRQPDNRVVVARWFYDNVPAGSTVLQSGSRYGLVQFWDRRFPYREWRWDGFRRTFLLNGKPLSMSHPPHWIIVQDSPLPSSTQDVVADLLRKHYVLAATFTAFSRSDDLVYDQQDAFFVPFAGLERVARPGPNFSVYKHDGAPATLEAAVGR